MKRKGSGGDDASQLMIDWPQRTSATVNPPPSLPLAAAGDKPVLKLRWDFTATFPQPTEEAIDAGRILEEDTTPEALRSIHQEHAREALATLHDLDAILDARRRGTDPATGQTPRTAASRERLAKRLESEPIRLEHAFTVLMDVYEEVFGGEARDAFAKAVRGWHAGVEVVAEVHRRSKPSERSALFPTEVMPRNARPPRIPARLPVPRPLPDAVAAKRFGEEENGKPVRPGPNEVRAITEQHAEKLIDLLDGLRASPDAQNPSLLESFQTGILSYAEDFGPVAAQRLESYVRRQSSLDASDRRQR
jgi:hypothetical protein